MGVKIKRVMARRFLSIGDEPVDIDFAALGPVVHIRGVNRDAGEGSSNGSGKSTILEMIMYGLTGRLLKGLNHKQAVNEKYKGGTHLEVDFDVTGVGPCSILRRRNKDELVLVAGGKEYDLGLTETQNEIQRLTGLTYESLANVSFFGQHNRYAFLSCDPEAKRKIVETMFGLEKYVKRCKSAKDRRRDIEKEIARNAKSYEDWHGIAEAAARRLAAARGQAKTWADKVARDKAALARQIEEAERRMGASDGGRRQAEHDAAQAELAKVRERLASMDATREKLEEIAARNESEVAEANVARYPAWAARSEAITLVTDISRRINEARAAIRQAEEQEDGVVCGTCRQVVLKDGRKHFCDDQLALVASLESDLEAAERAKAEATEKLGVQEGKYAALARTTALVKEKRASLAAAVRQVRADEARLALVRPPEGDAELMAARERVAGLRGRLEAVEAEEDVGNPHDALVAEAQGESAEAEGQAAEYRELVKGQEETLPYYDYWVQGFGDDGIRSLVVEDILPPLNKRIGYWMHFLMDGRLSLSFKSAKMNEELQRAPPTAEGFVHNALSGGEHQRIDLGLSQAFAHVQGMSAGNVLSIVALDEVAAHVDREGVRALYRMIAELSRERQTLVITHDPELQDLLAEADQLVVEKKDGITRLVKSGG